MEPALLPGVFKQVVPTVLAFSRLPGAKVGFGTETEVGKRIPELGV